MFLATEDERERYYEVTPVLGAIRLELREGVPGIPARGKQGAYIGRMMLEQRFSPGEHWLDFAVRSDCFGEFRSLRDELESGGFQIGWVPVDDEGPLFLTTHGRPPRRDI